MEILKRFWSGKETVEFAHHFLYLGNMRPTETVGLMLGLLLAIDVTSHLPAAYSDMMRALVDSTKAELFLDQLGSQAR